MAQRANFYVLERIYATTDDNRKVIQILFEDTESLVVREFSGNLWGSGTKQGSAVMLELCAREIYGPERKFCVCVASKLNSYKWNKKFPFCSEELHSRDSINQRHTENF